MEKIKIKNEKLARILKSELTPKIALGAGLLIILLIFLSEVSGLGGGRDDDKKTDNAPTVIYGSQYASALEQELSEILTEISGVGAVKIMITLDGGGSPPGVRGVAIVSEGGDDPIIAQKIIQTVSKALGISSARVSVVR